jgi:hypothetical protein
MKEYLEKDLFLWKILWYTIGGNNAPEGFMAGGKLWSVYGRIGG